MRAAAGKRRIDDLERGDRRPEVEGARDEGHCENDSDLRERYVDPERVECPTEETDAAEGDEEADPGDRRRQHERKLHEGDERVPKRPPRVEIQYAAGVPKRRIASIEMVIVSAVTTERIASRIAAERGYKLARRHLKEHGDDRQEQEAEDDARGQDERRPEETVCGYAPGIGRNPCSFSAAWLLADRSLRIPRPRGRLLRGVRDDGDLVAHARLPARGFESP